MEVAAFWIGLAAVIIAGGWYKSRIEAQKHQTFRTIVEKTGNVDEAQLRLLIAPPRPNPWESSRGDSYRFLRGVGAVLIFLGGGGLMFGGALLLAFVFAPSQTGSGDGIGIFMALGFAALILGAGLFYSSRFAEKPAESERPRAGSHNE